MRSFRNASEKDKMDMPYGTIYSIAPEYGLDEERYFMSHIDGLVEMTALRLFTYCLGFQAKADADLIDQFINDPSNYIFSFGTGAVMFPKYTLIQCATNDLMRRFCLRLIKETTYIDASGGNRQIDEHLIDEHVNKKVDEYSTLILDELSKNPREGRSISDENKIWVKKLKEDIERKKYDFYHQFDKVDGYYSSLFKQNYGDAVGVVKEKIENDLLDKLNETNSLRYISVLLNYYKSQFAKLGRLLELQGCNKKVDDLKNLINEAIAIFKSSKSIDQDTLMENMINQIFEQFVLIHEFKAIKEVLEIIREWKIKVGESINSLSNKADEIGRAHV